MKLRRMVGMPRMTERVVLVGELSIRETQLLGRQIQELIL